MSASVSARVSVYIVLYVVSELRHSGIYSDKVWYFPWLRGNVRVFCILFLLYCYSSYLYYYFHIIHLELLIRIQRIQLLLSVGTCEDLLSKGDVSCIDKKKEENGKWKCLWMHLMLCTVPCRLKPAHVRTWNSISPADADFPCAISLFQYHVHSILAAIERINRII